MDRDSVFIFNPYPNTPTMRRAQQLLEKSEELRKQSLRIIEKSLQLRLYSDLLIEEASKMHSGQSRTEEH